MHTLFSFLGKIEDLRLYPSLRSAPTFVKQRQVLRCFIFRDASVSIQSRCCYLKFLDEGVLPISLHMTNTVFIDRAIIVQVKIYQNVEFNCKFVKNIDINTCSRSTATRSQMRWLALSLQTRLPGPSLEKISMILIIVRLGG